MLLLTRTEGTIIYGGKQMTADIQQTYDHKIRFDRIVDDFTNRYIEVSVTDRDGLDTIYILNDTSDEVFISKDVRLVFMGIRSLPQRGGRNAFTVKVGLDAPKTYKILRDNANKRKL